MLVALDCNTARASLGKAISSRRRSKWLAKLMTMAAPSPATAKTPATRETALLIPDAVPTRS